MEFDAELLNSALGNLRSRYQKILIVNLSKDRYVPIVIADDELAALRKEKSYKISEYWEWFANSEFIHDDDRVEFKEFARTHNPNGHMVYRRKMNGEYRWVLMEITPSINYKKDNQECVLYVKDIHDIYTGEYNYVVDKLGTTDQMTGLYNKFAFERDCKAVKGYIGVLYADVNGLKYTNDNLGHKAGDELINSFASLIKINFSNCRCYHLSGDEFAVISSEDIREFIKMAIKFHKSLWTSGGIPMAAVGYSVGSSDEIERIISDAEQAMYDDKAIFYVRYPKQKRD